MRTAQTGAVHLQAFLLYYGMLFLCPGADCIAHTIDSQDRQEENNGVDDHQRPFRQDAARYKADIECILFQEKPVVFHQNITKFRPEGDADKRKAALPTFANVWLYFTQRNVQNAPSHQYAVVEHCLHRLIAPGLAVTNAGGVAQIHHRRQYGKNDHWLFEPVTVVIELDKADQRAQHGTDVKGKLIGIQAAVDKFVNKKVGNIGCYQSIGQKAKELFFLFGRLAAVGEPADDDTAKDQYEIDDVCDGKGGNGDAGIKMGHLEELNE